MSNELAVLETDKNALSAVDIRRQVNLIQEVMEKVMKGPSKENPEGIHYGIIPGTKKNTLYKAGAEKLLMTFRLGASYEELPGSSESDDFICYKIKCTLTHIGTGNIVGSAIGACNSKEKKYRTRFVYANKASQDEKLIGTKETRKGFDGKPYDVYIIPQDPWDVQNTLYKMACKRALIAAVINATGASDIFNQDIEDTPDVDYSGAKAAAKTKPAVSMPKEKKPEATATKETSQTVAPTDEKPLSIEEALEQGEGTDPFDVMGSLVSYDTTSFKKKKDGSTGYKTAYTIIDNNDDEMTISKWGQLKENVEVSDIVRFTKVNVGMFRDTKQFMADDIVLVSKGANNA